MLYPSINEMRKKKIVFIITHDLELISKVCTGCIYISKGKIAEKFKLSGEDEYIYKHKLMNQKYIRAIRCLYWLVSVACLRLPKE